MNIIAGLLLLVIPAYLIWQLDRQQLRATAIGTLRMMVQVAVVGVLTMLVWRFDSLWLCLLWVVLTTVLTAFILLRRTQLSVRRLFLPVATGLLVSTLAVGSYELFVVLSPHRPTSAHWIIPISGVLLAHSLVINIHALHTYVDALRGDSLPYYTAIGNGASRLRALLPYAARALHNGITPTTDKLATTALFAMPMLLAGLLMGGLSPLNAAFVFATLVVASIVAAMLTQLITLWAADRQLFDRRGQFRLIAIAILAIALTACRHSTAPEPSAETPAQPFVSTTTTPGLTDVNRQKVIQYELPAALNDRPELLLARKGYTSSYNSKTRCPNWVAWHLTKAHTYGNNQRSAEKFTEDLEVKAPRATDNDYFNSRYDRGHMCPAGDNKWDVTAMRQSFLFTNICPQNHALNKYEWNDLEIKCRDWARKYGAIDIVCGPLYYENQSPRFIGQNRVRVPDAFFKVVLCRQEQPKAIGFIYQNNGRKVKMADVVCTVDEVEELTGIDFFPQLDDKTELRIEASANLSDW